MHWLWWCCGEYRGKRLPIQGIIQQHCIDDNADDGQGKVTENNAEAQGDNGYKYSEWPDKYKATDEQNCTDGCFACHKPTNSIDAEQRIRLFGVALTGGT